jgi:predicted nucleic acid-binding protein
MPMAVLDTNANSDLMRDHTQRKAHVAQRRDPIATSAAVVGEIRYGLSRLPMGKKRSELEARAQSILGALRIEPITEPVADSYGRLKATLEGQGLNADDNDLWIAATALTLGAQVVTRDHVFTKVPGLQVTDWSN